MLPMAYDHFCEAVMGRIGGCVTLIIVKDTGMQWRAVQHKMTA
jgi:hypothetical protein